MNFFVVSAGKPGSDYLESNFNDIIKRNEFALHENTQQKGTYFSIEQDDVLILKYERKFVAYGVVFNRFKRESEDFALRVKVLEWVFYDSKNLRSGVSRKGIQKATIGGGRYGTVKTVRPNFGLDKIREINHTHPTFNEIFDLYNSISSNLVKEGEYFRLHEELFNLLLDKSESDPEFTFVIRDSNNSNMLDEGYWFFGEETVAISFWTGMDYLNNRPAISFLINPNQHCELIIQTDIYKELRKYLLEDNWNTAKLSLEKQDELFLKRYNSFQLTDYKNCLEEFLKNDFIYINRLLEEVQQRMGGGFEFNDSSVTKFPIQEFNFRLNNIFRYRTRNAPGFEIYSFQDEKRADTLLDITIRDYGLIKNEQLDFGNAKWVFITGENGSGKTMLLRAIGTALGNRTLSKQELRGEFSVDALLQTDNREITFKRIQNENVRGRREIVSRGLAMYGPYRLEQTSTMVKDDTFRKALSKTGTFKSLFEDSSKLLSLDKQLEFWKLDSKRSYNINENRIKQILSLLPKIIPDLRQVEYFRKGKNKFEFKYLLQTQGSDELMPLKWNELSSGNKSILNLVSDIIIRLFYQQPKVTDPSELRGIVLIDEIDLHLHPKAQRDLVVILSETFPLIQFIVSTHSPIPLLGAPKNSAIYVVKRNWVKGVFTERLDDKVMFDRILPNTILNSPIFGMDDLVPFSKEDEVDIILDDKYSDAILYNKLEKDVESYFTNENIKDLIEIFKNHDEK